MREGYTYVTHRCQRNHSDVFLTRLMLQPTLCLRGRDCAELFYDERRFRREGAAPARLRRTLLGEGGVQGLDDDAHRHRKAMFLDVLAPARVRALAHRVDDGWERAAAAWERADQVVLLDAVSELLCGAVCEWAGVPLRPREVRHRTRQLRAMIDGGGGVGPRYLRGVRGRQQGERWAAGLVERARVGELEPAPGTALEVIAGHRGLDGEPLDPHDAAVELLNVLRPTVAVALYVAFAAVALHHHPSYGERLAASDDLLDPFAQEVRRFYPLFPFVAARVRQDFEWRGLTFPAGVRALLDLYGTNHDARLWEEPSRFLPERFLGRTPGPFELVPQGGGDPRVDHRCPGEDVALALLRVSLAHLTRAIRYQVPHQDLRVRLSRMPALPESGVVLRSVRRVGRLGEAAAG